MDLFRGEPFGLMCEDMGGYLMTGKDKLNCVTRYILLAHTSEACMLVSSVYY